MEGVWFLLEIIVIHQSGVMDPRLPSSCHYLSCLNSALAILESFHLTLHGELWLFILHFSCTRRYTRTYWATSVLGSILHPYPLPIAATMQMSFGEIDSKISWADFIARIRLLYNFDQFGFYSQSREINARQWSMHLLTARIHNRQNRNEKRLCQVSSHLHYSPHSHHSVSVLSKVFSIITHRDALGGCARPCVLTLFSIYLGNMLQAQSTRLNLAVKCFCSFHYILWISHMPAYSW